MKRSCIIVVLLALLVLPGYAQLTLKVGPTFGGTYRTEGKVLVRFPAGRTQQVPLDRSDDTSAGLLVGAEFVDGKVWQAGIGVEHLFPRSVSGHEGRFSFTSAYVTTRLQAKGVAGLFVSSQFGWTLFRGDGSYTDPAYSGVPLDVYRDNAKIELRGTVNYGASVGVVRGPFRVEVAYLSYHGKRRLRENARTAGEVTRVTDLKTVHRSFSLLLGYTLRTSR